MVHLPLFGGSKAYFASMYYAMTASHIMCSGGVGHVRPDTEPSGTLGFSYALHRCSTLSTTTTLHTLLLLQDGQATLHSCTYAVAVNVHPHAPTSP
eukprot:5807178-Prymnesium_polylepis.1